MSRNSDFSHLEGDLAAVVDDLGTDLDELLLRLLSDQSLIGSGVARVRRKAHPRRPVVRHR